MAVISEFRGDYGFLSNFYLTPVEYEGVLYPTAEHAFQAAKSVNPVERNYVKQADTPGRAKRRGRTIQMQEGWDEIKLGAMEVILRSKFENKELRELLIDTHPAKLIEGNWWGDTYWGMTMTAIGLRGDNHLGELLMKLRREYRGEV